MPKSILKRRQFSGFVKYPKDWPKRIIGGRAAFQTRCDHLVGPCSCGYVHRENEGWVKETLEDQNAEIEQFVIQRKEEMVYIPRYWCKPKSCNVLVGECSCGKTHASNEKWVRELLDMHNATIVGEDLSLPVQAEDCKLDTTSISSSDLYYIRGHSNGRCDCNACRVAMDMGRNVQRNEI